MATRLIEKHLEGAEIYYGEAGRQASLELLAELHLPNGLLLLEEIVEVGRNRETGFVWLKQKKPTTHFWPTIGKITWSDKEITAFIEIEKRKLKKLTGVKTKELLVWVSVGEIYINEKDHERIEFKNTTSGISRSFPVWTFMVDDKKNDGD